MTVVSHFREILNCELRERRPRAREYRRRDMHYTMDARFSRLISLKSTRASPVAPGVFSVIEVENQICENIRTRAEVADERAASSSSSALFAAAEYKYGRGLTRLLCRAPIILNALVNAEVGAFRERAGSEASGYKKVSTTKRIMGNAIMQKRANIDDRSSPYGYIRTDGKRFNSSSSWSTSGREAQRCPTTAVTTGRRIRGKGNAWP